MLKNITLSADEELILRARKKAHRERTSLNATFRRWLRQYANKSVGKTNFRAFMATLDYACPGRKFSRDEMNER